MANNKENLPGKKAANASWRRSAFLQLDGRVHHHPVKLTQDQLDTDDPAIGNYGIATSLDLSNCGLTEIPNVIRHFPAILKLDLSGNMLQEASQNLERLGGISALILRNNDLQEIPSWVFQLENLQGLDLSDNQISVVPPEIGKLRNLFILVLNNNQIQNLPKEVASLSGLEQAANHPRNAEGPPNLEGGLFIDGNPLNKDLQFRADQEQPDATLDVFEWLKNRREIETRDSLGVGLGDRTSFQDPHVDGNSNLASPETELTHASRWTGNVTLEERANRILAVAPAALDALTFIIDEYTKRKGNNPPDLVDQKQLDSLENLHAELGELVSSIRQSRSSLSQERLDALGSKIASALRPLWRRSQLVVAGLEIAGIALMPTLAGIQALEMISGKQIPIETVYAANIGAIALTKSRLNKTKKKN